MMSLLIAIPMVASAMVVVNPKPPRQQEPSSPATIPGTIESLHSTWNLNAAESLMLDSVTSGTSFLNDQGTSHLSIRGGLIAWLCGEGSGLVTPFGVRVDGVNIRGDIDLEHKRVSFPLELTGCTVNGAINLKKAKIGSLVLSGSKCSEVMGTRLHATGSVLLSEGFECAGPIFLPSCVVEGDLNLMRSTLGDRTGDPSQPALTLDRASIAGVVFLRGSSVYGAMHVRGTSMAALLCESSAWTAPGELVPNAKPTLTFTDIRVDGPVDFSGARIDQTLVLDGAIVAGDVMFVDSVLKGVKEAVSAEGISVGGSLRLDGMKADGAVLLDRTKIAESLVLNGARLFGKGSSLLGHYLEAHSVEINGVAPFIADGQLDLSSATINSDMICVAAETSNLVLQRAVVKRTLHLGGVRLQSVDLRGASVGSLDLEESAKGIEESRYRLNGLTYAQMKFRSDIATSDMARWLSGPSGEPYWPQPYEQLSVALIKSGNRSDAKQILISKNRARRQKLELGVWRTLLSYLLEFSIGFGYATHRALIMLCILLLLGTVLARIAWRERWLWPCQTVNLDVKAYVQDAIVPTGYPKFQALAYSFDTLVPLVNLRQQDFWVPSAPTELPVHSRKSRARLYSAYVSFHAIAGWTLSTLLAVGVTGLADR